MLAIIFNVFIYFLVKHLSSEVIGVYSQPPPRCFQSFKWQDCGKPPRAVMYYYQAGSRCEMGMWRGCEPNGNMFRDEYDCVKECIFSPKAADSDFHKLNDIDFDSRADEQDEKDADIDTAFVTAPTVWV